MIRGEAGAPIWHRAYWVESKLPVQRQDSQVTRARATIGDRMLRDRMSLLNGLGIAPWVEDVFSMAGSTDYLGSVVGRDFAPPASPASSLMAIVERLPRDALTDEQLEMALSRLREAEIEERRRFVELASLVDQVASNGEFLDSDVLAYRVSMSDWRVARRDRNPELLAAEDANRRADEKLVEDAAEIVR